ncbi:metallophosphoesterase family protein [Nocardiopsis rhodophaea]|uniref:metallophosphoesterase family protein n=1 Tax=Nocardiopsis rhodophaea TaxID=280238 RepID=UPI0031D3477D
MSARNHHARTPTRRALALIRGVTATVVVAATTVAAPLPAAAAAAPERVTLSPTADPSTSQTVTWRTPDDGAPVLEIAPTGATERIRRIEGKRTGEASGVYYRATADGLEPASQYRYRVGGAGGDWHTFTTAADSADPFTFLYFGDVQNDITRGAAPTVKAALADTPDARLALHAGDLVNQGSDDDEWDEWYGAFAPATAAINQVAAPGNHEYSGSQLSPHWPLQFPGAGNGPDNKDLDHTAYYTDYQNVRFIVLNASYTNAPWFSYADWLGDQERWLRGVLDDNPNRWTVVTFHQPLFANRPGRDNEPLRRYWLDVFEDYNVDLVLQGHDHSYGRGNLVANRTDDPAVQTGPVYVVAVTGPKMYDVSDTNWVRNGAEARVQRADTQTYQAITVDGERMDYTASTADGEVVDAFTITKGAGGKHVTDVSTPRH